MAVEDSMKHQVSIEMALDAYSKGELVRMLSNLMKAYVIDGTSPLKPDVGRVHVPTHLRELDFPSLIETLKFHLNLSDLEKFNVIDGQVYVTLGDREYALHGPVATTNNTSTAPPAPTDPTSAAVPSPSPTATPSPRPRQNRGGGVFGGGSPAPQENLPLMPETKEASDAPPTEADDRFRMLELD